MEPYFRGDTRVAKSTSRRPIEESISRSLDYLMHSLAVFCILMATLVSAQPERTTTAWKDGSFHIGREGIVGRSDIILQKPNLDPQQAMPLGNGRLGLAVWAEGGYTAQLNRGDTFPLRLSPGQVVVPGL